jgi:hypothetical protein
MQDSWPNELVSAEAVEEEVTDEPRDHTHTGVDNVHTPFGRTRRHAPLLQPLSSDESGQKSAGNSHRSCHHHNPTA